VTAPPASPQGRFAPWPLFRAAEQLGGEAFLPGHALAIPHRASIPEGFAGLLRPGFSPGYWEACPWVAGEGGSLSHPRRTVGDLRSWEYEVEDDEQGNWNLGWTWSESAEVQKRMLLFPKPQMPNARRQRAFHCRSVARTPDAAVRCPLAALSPLFAAPNRRALHTIITQYSYRAASQILRTGGSVFSTTVQGTASVSIRQSHPHQRARCLPLSGPPGPLVPVPVSIPYR
jgi:hypothetical protein